VISPYAKWYTEKPDVAPGKPISTEHSQRYTLRRRELAGRILDFLLTPDGPDASFRGLAAAASVTRPTLVHYFDDHQGAICAAIALAGQRGSAHTDRLRAAADTPPQQALAAILTEFAAAWTTSLGHFHRIGFRAGLSDATVGRVYHDAILDPTLRAFEDLLGAYHQRGTLCVPSPRDAALTLFPPVLVALFSQHQLGGADSRPLDLDAFIVQHVSGFVRGHAADARK